MRLPCQVAPEEERNCRTGNSTSPEGDGHLDLDIQALYTSGEDTGAGMSNRTVNISFEDDLLREIDRAARRESRSRSEFLREAARAYIQRRERWDRIFAMGRGAARRKKLSPDDVSHEIGSYRRGKARRG